MGVLIAAGVAMKEGLRLKGTAKIYLFFLQLAILISSGSPLEARALRRATPCG
jgi:type II secretory pathway component PulF